MQISVWEKESFYKPKDIIIIGSGFTGLWCAWHLKQQSPGVEITIVDRGIIPTGASTRNAGFACFGSVTELLHDIQMMGEDKMLQLVEMRFNGLQQIRKVFKKPVIDFELCGGYELITGKNNLSKDQLLQHISRLNHLLKEVVKHERSFKLADNKIKSFGFAGIQHLIQNKLEGYLHSGKLCQALLQKVQALGVTVLNAVEINHFEKNNDTINLYTNQHLHLNAKKILICTNAFAGQLLPGTDITPARGQVLLTSPVSGLPFNGTFHYDEGYYYFRNLGNRVLLGGARNIAFEEENTAELTTSEKIQQELEQFLSTCLIPGKEYTITDRWSGIMGVGSDKMPILRELSPGVYCAVRMSGMGVALAPVIGEKAARMLL